MLAAEPCKSCNDMYMYNVHYIPVYVNKLAMFFFLLFMAEYYQNHL